MGTPRSFAAASSAPGLEPAGPRKAARHLDDQNVFHTDASLFVRAAVGRGFPAGL
jgi:hypothetical protein